MASIPASQAVAQFESLLSEAAHGHDVVIITDDGTAIKLVALSREPKPVFGSAKGLVHFSDDFDEPIEGFEEYM